MNKVNKLNIFFIVLETVIIIFLSTFLVFYYLFNMLPQKNELQSFNTKLETKKIEISQQEKIKQDLQQKHSNFVNNNKDNFEEYKKWEEKNQTINQYL